MSFERLDGTSEPTVVSMPMRDPAVQEWRQALGESTSARLRRVEAELGAALGALAATREQLEQLQIRLAHTDGTGPCAYRALAVDAMRERDYARAQLDDLIATRAKETS